MTRRAQCALAVLGAVVLAVHVFAFRDAAVDDAYVSYRYARNLARGAGLVYNAGERIEGYSNFLWTVLHAPVAARGADPLPASRAAGAVLLALSLLLLWDLARRHAPGVRGAGWLAVACAVADPGYVYWHFAGLEPPLVGMLLLLGLRALGTPAAVPIWLALLLTRIDAVVPVAVAAALELSRAPRRRALFLWSLIAAGFVAFTGWRFGYYGAWMPNAARAKLTGPLAHFGTSVRDVIMMLPLCPALAAAPLFLRARNLPLPVRAALCMTVVQVAFILVAGGDWMPLHRLFAPFVPLAVFGVVVGIARWAPEWLQRRALVLAAGSVGLGFATFTFSNAPVAVAIHAENVRIGRLMGEQLLRVRESDLLLATAAAGATPFFSDLQTVDTSGLTDSVIARTPIGGRSPILPVGHERGNGAYVLGRKPDLLVFTLGRSNLPGMYAGDAQMAFDARLYAHYESFGFGRPAEASRRRFLFARAEPLRKLAFLCGGDVVRSGFGATVTTRQELQLKILRRTAIGASPVRLAFYEIAGLDPSRARAALEANAGTITAGGYADLLEPMRARLALLAGDVAAARVHAAQAAAAPGPYGDLFRLWLAVHPEARALR